MTKKVMNVILKLCQWKMEHTLMLVERTLRTCQHIENFTYILKITLNCTTLLYNS